MPKKGISISSLLENQSEDIVPITSDEMKTPEKKTRKKIGGSVEVINIDGDDTEEAEEEDGPIQLTKDSFETTSPSQVQRTESGKIDIKSILSNEAEKQNEAKKDDKKAGEEKAAPVKKTRKPRQAKKKAEEGPEKDKEKEVKPKRTRNTRKKAEIQAEEDAKANAKTEEKKDNKINDDKKDQKSEDVPKANGPEATAIKAEPATISAPPVTDHKETTTTITTTQQPISNTPNESERSINTPIPPIIPQRSQSNDSASHPSTPNLTIPILQSQSSYTPEQTSTLTIKPSKPTDIKNLMNNDDNDNKSPVPLLPSHQQPIKFPQQLEPKPHLLPSILNKNDQQDDNGQISFNAQAGPTGPTVKPKPKQQRKPSNNTTNNDTKNNKAKTTKATSNSNAKKKTPTVDDKKPELTPIQNQNLNLIRPDPKANESLSPPKIIEINPSSPQTVKDKDEKLSNTPVQLETTRNTEPPIIALHVPLRPPKQITPAEEQPPGVPPKIATQVVFNILKMAEDKYGYKNLHPEASKFSLDLMQDDDIDDEMDAEDEEEEEVVPQAPIDGRRLQKGKPKIGQYDKEDPFIDDSEMVWEEQRASTKDGFFVFYGPLVEEGKNAKIERADGTIKRNRKRVAGTSNLSGGGGGNGGVKKRAIGGANAKQPTTKLVPIAPAQGNIDIAPKI